jgi:hypothetical protein
LGLWASGFLTARLHQPEQNAYGYLWVRIKNEVKGITMVHGRWAVLTNFIRRFLLGMMYMWGSRRKTPVYHSYIIL